MRKKYLIKASLLSMPIIVILLCLTLSACGLAINLATVKQSQFKQLTQHIYISPDMNDQETQQIQKLIEQSKAKVIAKYGDYQATPHFIVTSNKIQSDQFQLGDVPATTYFLPWEADGYIVLGVTTRDVNIIAHEMVHAEVADRLGGYSKRSLIPVWFDEGVALQVDEREQYMNLAGVISTQAMQDVQMLHTPKQFWTQNKAQNIKHYQAAKQITMQILDKIDMPLFELLEKIKQGESFETLISVAFEK